MLYDVVTDRVCSDKNILWKELIEDSNIVKICIRQITPDPEEEDFVCAAIHKTIFEMMTDRIRAVDDYKNRKYVYNKLIDFLNYISGRDIKISTSYSSLNRIITNLSGEKDVPGIFSFNVDRILGDAIIIQGKAYSWTTLSKTSLAETTKHGTGETRVLRNYENEIYNLFQAASDILNTDDEILRVVLEKIKSATDIEDVPFTVTVPEIYEETRDVEKSKKKSASVNEIQIERLSVLQNLLVDQINARNYIGANETIKEINKIRDEFIDFFPIPAICSPKSSLETEKFTNNLRQEIKSIARSIETEHIPIIHFGRLLRAMNELCSSMMIEQIFETEALRSGSYQALVLVGDCDLPSEKVIIKLENGMTRVLPTENADLSDLDKETLEEILIHISSLDYTEKRFNNLRYEVSKEIALRTK